MKLNLLINNSGDVRNGYLNIDPSANPEDPYGRVRCDLDNLDPLVDANEATEVVALDILDYYATTDVDRVLNHWLSKLAHGGTLTVSVVDLREVSRQFLAGGLGLDEANLLLHGEQDGPMRFRMCSLTLDHLSAVLENKGLKVLKRRIVDRRAVVTCQRP